MASEKVRRSSHLNQRQRRFQSSWEFWGFPFPFHADFYHHGFTPMHWQQPLSVGQNSTALTWGKLFPKMDVFGVADWPGMSRSKLITHPSQASHHPAKTGMPVFGWAFQHHQGICTSSSLKNAREINTQHRCMALKIPLQSPTLASHLWNRNNSNSYPISALSVLSMQTTNSMRHGLSATKYRYNV